MNYWVDITTFGSLPVLLDMETGEIIEIWCDWTWGE